MAFLSFSVSTHKMEIIGNGKTLVCESLKSVSIMVYKVCWVENGKDFHSCRSTASGGAWQGLYWHLPALCSHRRAGGKGYYSKSTINQLRAGYFVLSLSMHLLVPSYH